MPKMIRLTVTEGFLDKNEPTAIPASSIKKVTPVHPTWPIYKNGARTLVWTSKDEFTAVNDEMETVVKQLEDDGKPRILPTHIGRDA